MEMTNYTKEEINDAIYKVVTTQFKKDAKESHRIVEEVGYKIIKCDGSFKVRNPETYRYVQVEFSHGYFYNAKVYTVSGCKYFRAEDGLKAFDFVGQLETTRKVYDEPDPDYYESEAVIKHSQIKSMDSLAKCYDNDIKTTLEKIAKLQEDLIRYTEYKIEYETKARNLRKKYGLI